MDNYIYIETKLGNFNLDINTNLINGINCFFGPSGAGKTSIINCISGLHRAKNCKIIINGETLVDTDKKYFKPIDKRRIGYVFQDSRLFPHLNIKQNLFYGYKLSRKKQKFFSKEEISLLLGLNHLMNRYPHNLSGGEKQRVAIGRAILSQPDILLMDEPLSSLDQEKKSELISYLVKINDLLNIPALYVSHSTAETFTLGNKIYFIDKGKIVFEGDRNKALGYYNKNDSTLFKDSFIKGVVGKINKKENLAEIRLGKESLTVFSSQLITKQIVIVKIKSSDIIISKFIPKKISSLNYICTKVTNIIYQNNLVCLILHCGENNLKAHLTTKSFKSLGISKGTSCYAIIKALNINDIIDISLI